MKVQIRRFNPHQNAKVLAVLMAVASLVFLVPLMLLASATAPADARPSVLYMMVGAPIGYLVFGYLSVVVACWLYNWLFRYVGGLEFESGDAEGVPSKP